MSSSLFSCRSSSLLSLKSTISSSIFSFAILTLSTSFIIAASFSAKFCASSFSSASPSASSVPSRKDTYAFERKSKKTLSEFTFVDSASSSLACSVWRSYCKRRRPQESE